ncbi:hypothetical protein BMW23_0571 [Bodo saltans virus]|uniref:Transmembrane protein n=1 Tax=Bodo saltans virus TaxID=2024608 RepID=A0A2H4UUM9_9VIRU|nr:hypothetical protein QJ851_gp0555 [Bodo saltans virus]ATZ80618.1 hypothetical protein BMW23_0571 [Bodo saltans virus]
MSNKDFDLQQFNTQFDSYKKFEKKKNKEKENNKLQLLNEEANSNNSLLDKPLFGLFIGIKDTWFSIFDDIINKKVSADTFFINDRLFYIGFTIVILSLLLYMMNSIFGDDNIESEKTDITKEINQQGVIIEKHYIYTNEKKI